MQAQGSDSLCSRICQVPTTTITTFFFQHPCHDLQTTERLTTMYPEYPPELNDEQSKYLLSNLKDWSIAHGLAVRVAPTWISEGKDPEGALATTAPVTFFPSLFPRVCFEQAKSVAKAYNELYSAIPCDEAWLQGVVEE